MLETAITEIEKEIKPKGPVTDIMLKHGYPLRAVELVQQQDALYGPALDEARRIWKDYIMGGDANIVLCDGCGTGKTTMATLWAYHRLRKGMNCGHYKTPYEFFTTPDFPHINTPYFVFDNFSWSAFQHEMQRVIRFLDMRYQNKLITIIITPDIRDEFIDNAPRFVMNRYLSNGCILSCDWDSYTRTSTQE